MHVSGNLSIIDIFINMFLHIADGLLYKLNRHIIESSLSTLIIVHLLMAVLFVFAQILSGLDGGFLLYRFRGENARKEGNLFIEISDYFTKDYSLNNSESALLITETKAKEHLIYNIESWLQKDDMYQFVFCEI